MTKIKMCGLRRSEDIKYANILLPDYIGYVFAEKSRRYITAQQAEKFSGMLDKRITSVGVFVNSSVENVIEIVKSGIIKTVQLHGTEDDNYIKSLKNAIDVEVIKAFIVKSAEDIRSAENSTADCVLLDAGMGDGRTFNHGLLENISRPYFLAGGLDTENIADIIKISPYAVDVSSGIETDGLKDFTKMKKFIDIIRK